MQVEVMDLTGKVMAAMKGKASDGNLRMQLNDRLAPGMLPRSGQWEGGSWTAGL
ncbi:MAG: hypothetical protein U0176_12870 [Bacteroidia bacterium]